MNRPARLLLPTLLVAALLPLAGCGRKDDGGKTTVSVIGGEIRLRDPATGASPDAPGAALLGAVAQGLVRVDAGGLVEPGLAIRWAISDDGLYYTFRIDHDLADADAVVAQLRRLLRRYRAQTPGAGLDAIREIVAVTPEVIEMRLSAPRPELMGLLAGPDFALLIAGKGTGPLHVDGKVGALTLLQPKPLDIADQDDDRAKAAAKRRIRLRGERVALAVARYANGQAALVTGGSFTDFLYTRLANIAPRDVQVDPAIGLFGFRIAGNSPALMAVEVRQALSMALDRDAIGTALGIAGWRSSQAILPPGLADVAAPTPPFWARALANVRGQDAQDLAGRIATARHIVDAWRSQHGGSGPIHLRIALPDGVGSTILFATIRRQWARIGITAERVGPREAADLRLIDEVAPVNQADWFLAHFVCAAARPCSEEADWAFAAARDTTDPALRANLLVETEQRIAGIAPFIPIAQPVRWSLAAPDLAGFRANARATHPLEPLIGN